MCVYIYVYIYIYIERERDIDICAAEAVGTVPAGARACLLKVYMRN